MTTFTTLEVVALAEVWRDVKRRGVAADRDIFGRSPTGDANILPEERTLSLEKDKEREEYPRGRVAINGSREQDLEREKTSLYVWEFRNEKEGRWRKDRGGVHTRAKVIWILEAGIAYTSQRRCIFFTHGARTRSYASGTTVI